MFGLEESVMAPGEVRREERPGRLEGADERVDQGQYSKPLPPMNSRRKLVGGTWSG